MRKSIIVGGISVALLGVAAAVFALVALPSFNRWQAGVERVGQLEEAIRGRERILARDRALEDRRAEVTALQQSIASFLPSRRDPETIVNIMTSSAGSRGVVLEEVAFPAEDAVAVASFAEVAPNGPPQSFKVALKASGSYQALKTFFGALAQSARLLDIRRLAVVAEEGSELLRADAEFSAYYRPR